MSDTILLFETDPNLGTPKLKLGNGSAGAWSQRDLNALEETLRSRYESFVRDGEGTVVHKGQTLHVKKKAGDTSRQPTLELRSSEAARRPADGFAALLPPSSPATEWGKGLVAEIDRLLASKQFSRAVPAEMAMLRLVRDELRALVETKPDDMALLILISILRTAEQVSRAQRPSEPHPYAYALGGIERVLSDQPASPQSPWGQLTPRPDDEPPPSWLGRFWSCLSG